MDTDKDKRGGRSQRVGATSSVDATQGTVPIVAHKFFPPPVKFGAINRSGILQRLLGDPTMRVAVLQGPPGSGKSTTLRQLLAACHESQCRTAWITFDDADNDPRRFEVHFQALLDGLLDEHAPSASDDARPNAGQLDLTDRLIDGFIRARVQIALFLDEFQALRHESILLLFKALLPRLPDSVRVFIGSRTLPEVGLANLLVNGSGAVLRANDLCFSPEEAATFFARDAALAMNAEEVDLIYRRTEGWPAGLQLFRLAMANPKVRGSLERLASQGMQELADYLTDTVLSLQPPDVREFLLRTSLLRRLTGPLCDTVSQRQGSQDLLLRLERSGLFLSVLDSASGWFKYHGLFAKCLSDTLEREAPERVIEVHLAAARWHLQHDSYEESVHHSVAAGDHALAVDALNLWATQLTANAELVTVERWYDQIPFCQVVPHVDLLIKSTYALVFLRRRIKLRPVLDVLRQYRGQGNVSDTTSPDVVLAMAALFEDRLRDAAAMIDEQTVLERVEAGFPAFELTAAANLVAFARISEGRFEDARRLLGLARAHQIRSAATFSLGYTAAVANISFILRGRLQDALSPGDCETAQVTLRLDNSLAPAALVASMIWALYEDNQLDRMEQLAAQYQHDIARSVVPDFIAATQLLVSRMHQIRGRGERSVAAIDELEQIAQESGWNRLSALADWERVRLAIAAGDVPRARFIANCIAPPHAQAAGPWFPSANLIEGPETGTIRLAIAEERYSDASRAIGLSLGACPEHIYLRIKLCLLDAILQKRKGLPKAASRSLRRALDLGRPGRFIRMFLDEGPLIVELLRTEYHSMLSRIEQRVAVPIEERDYVEKLLAASGTDLSQTSPLPAQRELEALSDRELEILRLLCQGVSNRDIANGMFVSENTVKFHLKKIFAKLGVRSRAQAIHTAHDLRLVG